MPAHVQLCPIELPGHGTRFSEPLIDKVDHLIASLVRDILPILDCPFFVFGHSLGALLGFEFSRHLVQKHDLTPDRLVVSGRRAPHKKSPPPLRHTLPDQQLIDNLTKLGGMPDGLAEDRDLMRLMLPILRADFRLTELYEGNISSPLPFPMTAIVGDNDPEVSVPEMHSWQDVRPESFSLHPFVGDHFYLLQPEARRNLILLICQHINLQGRLSDTALHAQ